MNTLYHSERFAVVQFEFAAPPAALTRAAPEKAVQDALANPPQDAPLERGGFEIVDKFARKEIFLEGALAEQFRQGVEALIRSSPSEDDIDEFIGGYTVLAQQPVILH
jgi:hypothetical protein